MRGRLALLGPALLGLALAGPAGSAPLNWAGTATSLIGDFPEAITTGGGVATVNSSNGIVPAGIVTLRLAEGRGNLHGKNTIPIDSSTNGLSQIVLETTHETGTFASIDLAANSLATLYLSKLPIRGMARVCILSVDCSFHVDVPLEQGPDTAIGVGGVFFVSQGAIRISVQAAPWSVKTVTVTDQVLTVGGENTTFVTFTARGFIHDPLSFSTVEAQPSGVVQLVTPTQIATNLAFGTNAQIGWIAVLKVHFIPEPGLLLSLGTAIAGLALLGRSRLGRQRRR